MSDELQFCETWNKVMNGFQMTEDFFRDSNCQKIALAFEELCLYINLDVEQMKKHSEDKMGKKMQDVNLVPPKELVQMFSIFKFIIKTYAFFTPSQNASQKPLCLYDIFSVGPKRLLRIFRELFNFFLYCKIKDYEIQEIYNGEQSKIKYILDELSSLKVSEESIEKEIKSLDNKIQQSKSVLPQPNEFEEWEQRREELMQDMQQQQSQMEVDQKEKASLMDKEMKIIDEIRELKGFIVEDSDMLLSNLNTLKKESEDLQLQNSSEETNIKNNIKLMHGKTKSVELARVLLTEFKKSNGLADKCNEISEVAIDVNNVTNLEEQRNAALNSCNNNKKNLIDVSAKFEELSKTISINCNDIDREIPIYQEQSQKIIQENEKLNSIFNKASLVFAEYEKSEQQLYNQIEQVESVVLDLIHLKHEYIRNNSANLVEKTKKL